ncbi:ribosomal large subunit binding protein [Aureococcus anophagefferens]|nr:ribosomal large subunit binding protein [Aureococcus anophagefferens]
MVARALTLSLAAIWAASALPARLAPRHRRPTCRFAGDDGDEFDVDVLLLETEERMDKSIGALRNNLGTLRTGRASPDILARVVVDYYGAETPLNQLAAIVDANLGMAPNNDGELIRLNVPALTEDRRKEILKQAKAAGEDAKVAIRNIRKGANSDVKKQGKDLSEDVAKDANNEIQKLTDKLIKSVDEVVAAKEKGSTV